MAHHLTDPAFLMALAVALAADVAADGRTSPRWGLPRWRGAVTAGAGLGASFGRFDGGGIAANVADELVAGVGFDDVLVDLLRQLVIRKRREKARLKVGSRAMPRRSPSRRAGATAAAT
jgi:hypothetical protein